MTPGRGFFCGVVGCVVGALSCGGKTSHDRDAVGGSPPAAGGSGAADGGEAGAAGHYSGRVTVSASRYQSVTSFTATADFVAGEPQVPSGCPSDGVSVGACCCGQRGLALPIPTPEVPNAGTVTITADGGATTLASLEPYPESDTFLAGRYQQTDCRPWTAGDTLGISASGERIHAFSVALPTGAPGSGIGTLAGAEPIVMGTTQNLQIVWEPAAGGDQSVAVGIESAARSCTCLVPDAAGQVTVDATLMRTLGPAPADPGTTSGTLRFERTHTAEASSDNATILLVSRVVEIGDVTFQ